ncbi:unannotated protein [freshwater metagenome]|uniref:Unannotated protein n=1 Tax=freshwater metagenome TaxID=449393 RepID=A0A6J6GTQ0_9ZZZZ
MPTATPGSGASGAVAASSAASAVADSVVGATVVAAAAGAGTAAGVPATAQPFTNAFWVTQIGMIIPSVSLNVLATASYAVPRTGRCCTADSSARSINVIPVKFTICFAASAAVG